MKWKCDADSKRDRELHQKQKFREKFDDQPERSKREDLVCSVCGYPKSNQNLGKLHVRCSC